MKVFRFTYSDTALYYDMIVLAVSEVSAFKLIRKKLDSSGKDSKKFISKKAIINNLIEMDINKEQVIKTEVNYNHEKEK